MIKRDMSLYFSVLSEGASQKKPLNIFFKNKENAQVKIENYFEI